MQIAWIIGTVALIVLFLYIKQYKKEAKPINEDSSEPVKMNNKGCSIAFYIFFAILIGVFVYYYILYRQSLG